MVTTVGITGGIGSGKSVVSAILAVMGYPVYDTDSRARTLMDRSSQIRDRLQALFGSEVYRGGQLNRPFLAERIFSDETSRKQVNAIVHPVVKSDFRAWAEAGNTPLAFMESAILFESGFRETVQDVWVVAAPDDIRLQRVMQRDGWTESHVRQRMASQLPQAEKIRRADTVIRNDGRQLLLPQIIAAVDALLR